MNLLKLEQSQVCLGATCVMTDVGEAIFAVADPETGGLFLSASMPGEAADHVVSLGTLPELSRLVALYRYDPFWMTPATGASCASVPEETQFLLVERRTSPKYLVVVPLVKDPFRCSLRGSPNGCLEVVAETGAPGSKASAFAAVYIAAGPNPFELMERAARSVAACLGSGRLRKDKPLPRFVDLFGWCTWDAFYQSVSGEKIREGLASFASGGIKPRFLILDDGWLSATIEPEGTRIQKRFFGFSADPQKFPGDLAPVVAMAKEEFGIDQFFVWHAIMGYWGGLDPAKLPDYEVAEKPIEWKEAVIKGCRHDIHNWYPKTCGAIPSKQIYRFYHDFHRHLRRQGVDGVKVDNQGQLEALCNGSESRVTQLRCFREALEGSAATHFNGNLINCMSGSNDMMLHALASTVTRTFTDFWPNKPDSHGLHIYANALNSAWFAHFVHPDWDMFQSGHPAGAFHAASRAISGGPVYVSDKPNTHNVALIQKLIFDDSTIVRCRGYARPTVDCLFVNPTVQDTLFKIYNHNASGSVIGVFNCRHTPESPEAVISGTLSPADIPGVEGKEFAVFSHYGRKLQLCTASDQLECSLKQLECELFTVVPVENGFAPIGLVDKFNSGGAILESHRSSRGGLVIRAKGSGDFLVFAREKPKNVLIDDLPTIWKYDPVSNQLTFRISTNSMQSIMIECIE